MLNPQTSQETFEFLTHQKKGKEKKKAHVMSSPELLSL